jgi:hypothetical protein
MQEMVGRKSDTRLAEACGDLGDPSEELLAAASLWARRPASEGVPLCDKAVWRRRASQAAARACLTTAAVWLSSLGLMLERQGINLNRKKLCRLYQEERLPVRKRGGRKRALGTRAPMVIPRGRNLRWSLGFVIDTFVSGRRFLSSRWSTTSPESAWAR